MQKKISLVVFLFFLGTSIYAQRNISVRAFGLTRDFVDNEGNALIKNKLDNKGNWLIEPGLLFAFEQFGDANVSFLFTQTLYSDATKNLAGYTQAELRYKFFRHQRHSATIGIGPTLFYRKDRSQTVGYVEDSFEKSGSLQYAVSWISGDFEYDYFLSRNTNLSLAINHLHPKAFTFSVGITYWLQKVKSCGCGATGGGKRH